MKKMAFFLVVVALCLLVSMDAMAQHRGGQGHRRGGHSGNHNRSDVHRASRAYSQPSSSRSHNPPSSRSYSRSTSRSHNPPSSRSYNRSTPRSHASSASRSQTQQIRQRASDHIFKSHPSKSYHDYRNYYRNYSHYYKNYWKHPPVVTAPRYDYIRPKHRIYTPPRYRHRHHYYYGWDPGWWVWPTVDYVWWNWASGTYVYSNPYVVYVKELPYNYSTPVAIVQQPQAVPQPQADAPEVIPAPAPEPVEGAGEVIKAPPAEEMAKHLQTARTEFQKGNYNATKKELEKAIARSPKDAALHEFLGLTLFAQGKYNQAAGVINAVIASGPGWDWDTMISFYADPDVYTEQLRDLESHVRQNKTDAATRFLLAYHYLVMDFVDNAEQQLKEVVKLQPKDVLSKRLLEMIEKSKKASSELAAPKRPSPQG